MRKSAAAMFFFGLIAFAVIMITVAKKPIAFDSTDFWFYRVLTALAAASISISIPGMLEIRYVKENDEMKALTNTEGKSNPATLAEKEPTITASGAIAVFVLVYLFNPI